MLSRIARFLTFLLASLLAFPCLALNKQERVIAGSPADSIEVRHLVLTGTNEEIGRALAEIAIERYGTRLEPSRDPLRTRAQRRYIEKNDPILYERLRGVAAAFGKRVDDDAWDYSGLGFTDLRGGCSIVHLPPQASTTGASVVSRDYDYSTGNLTFGFLPPGMLHPTARPYLIELHPDKGYASVAMVAYDLLSGVLDGMNSEGLTVAVAMDDELRTESMEPTLGSAPGLGVLQMLRLLLDSCANVEEAKEVLLMTKQYYEYIPCHFLIADRSGKSFVWEYSASHNKEYILENPGAPLVLTNFNLQKHAGENKVPTAEAAKAVCTRYSFLSEQLAKGPVTEDFLRATHKKVDAQRPPAPDAKRPPIRTFWHALYYPEARRVKFSYYLHDNPDGIARTDYLEFRLDASNTASAPAPDPVAAPAPAEPAPQPAAAKLIAGGAIVKSERNQVITVNLNQVPNAASLVPLLADFPRIEQLGLRGTNITDKDLEWVGKLTSLNSLGLAETNITDAGLAHLAKLTRLEVLNLSGTNIGDAGLANLKGLTGIAGLNLQSTKITDAGLAHLGDMGRLTKLNVSKTAVTDAGLAKAKKSLPFWVQITR